MADIIAINQTVSEQLISTAKAAGKVVVFRKIRHQPRQKIAPKHRHENARTTTGGYWPDGDGPNAAA